MKTCLECGCRVYALGCVNCNEVAYIEEQIQLTEQYGDDPQQEQKETPAEWAGYPLTWGDEG
jgi:hypothetical protein